MEAYRRLTGTGVTPRLLAGEPGVVVLEDLPGRRLDDHLVGSSRSTAERALIDMAAALGTVHRATLPSDSASAATGEPEEAETSASVTLDRFRAVCRDLGVRADVDDFTVGPLRTLTQLDVGPDNCIVTPDGPKLIDFELAALDHPLADAAHWRMGFPCSGCAGGIPDRLVAEMDAAHHAALDWRGERDALGADAADRAAALLLANRLVRLVEWDTLTEDWLWGRVGGRQRLLALVAGFDCQDTLPEFTLAVRRLETELRARWPGVAASLPVYEALA